METLKNLVKSDSLDNQWFSSNSGVFTGKIEDTSDNQVVWISDGTYCATFTMVQDVNTYYLTNYSFESNNKQGCSFIVE